MDDWVYTAEAVDPVALREFRRLLALQVEEGFEISWPEDDAEE